MIMLHVVLALGEISTDVSLICVGEASVWVNLDCQTETLLVWLC